MVFCRSTNVSTKQNREKQPLLSSDRQRKMRLWVVIGALAVAINASIAEITRNKNRGRGSMWW